MIVRGYLSDRKVGSIFVIRLGLLCALAMLPVLLAIPGAPEPVTAFILWPALNGVLFSITLDESMHWAYRQNIARLLFMRGIVYTATEIPLFALCIAGVYMNSSTQLAGIIGMTIFASHSALLMRYVSVGVAWLPPLFLGILCVLIPWRQIPSDLIFNLNLLALASILVLGLLSVGRLCIALFAPRFSSPSAPSRGRR